MNLDINDYEAVRNRLFIKVSSVGEILYSQKDIPYERRENLAITAHILVQQNKEHVVSTDVTNSMLESFGITKDQLFRDAAVNSSRIFPAQIMDMNVLIAELCMDLMPEEEKAGMTEDELQQILGDLETTADMGYPMLVITNEQKIEGAGAIFYPGAMDQIGRRMKGNYYILPSSIHETIVVPDDGNMKRQELEFMVKEVNQKQVAPEKRLTDSVYHYDTKNRLFEMAETYEKRMKNQKLSRSDHEKPENQKHKGLSF